MIELTLPYKCRHRDAGIQKVFPNAAFDLPNGGKWAPKGMENWQVPYYWTFSLEDMNYLQAKCPIV